MAGEFYDGSESDDEFDEYELYDDWVELTPEDVVREHNEARERAQSDPSFDCYTAYPPSQPKAGIGQYVASEGFRVPIITEQSEWEEAFDNGDAMLRSEMLQDYDGLSGLLSSERINPADYEDARGIAAELGSLLMRGLRSGEISGTEYMNHFRGLVSWAEARVHLMESAMAFGSPLFLDRPTASHWKYIDGTNVTAFADPHVEGRYHFGVIPAKLGKYGYQAVGSYQVEPHEHETPKTFRKHREPFVARPFIEYYDQISSLSNFDNTQNPVLEMIEDTEGNIHFLQYLKTNQKREFIEPFDLPSSEDTLRTTNVRGITPESGQEMKLFMAPNTLKKGMEGQGIYCNLTRPRGLQVQLASRAAGFILHEAYVSFQDNHFDSSPMYRPPLASGLDGCQENTSEALLRRLNGIVRSSDRFFLDHETVQYLDIKVTSNGREAAIESDWNLKTIAYDDIK